MFGNETVTVVRYLNEVLVPVDLQGTQEIADKFVYIDDNARPHQATQLNIFFTDNDVARMDWPT